MSPREELRHIAHVVSHRMGGFASAIIGLFALGWGFSSFSSGEMMYGIVGFVAGLGFLGLGWWALNEGQEHRESEDLGPQDEE